MYVLGVAEPKDEKGQQHKKKKSERENEQSMSLKA